MALPTQDEQLTFGVTFYRKVDEIMRVAHERGFVDKDPKDNKRFTVMPELKDRLLIGTVDAFQGREFDVVILSAVRSNRISVNKPVNRYGHLVSPNRLCVAMTRQKRHLMVAGDIKMFEGATDSAVEDRPDLSLHQAMQGA